jgi:hypothetical protein
LGSMERGRSLSTLERWAGSGRKFGGMSSGFGRGI